MFLSKLKPAEQSKTPRIIFSSRLHSRQSNITPTSSFVNRDKNTQNGHTSSILSDDRSSGVESLIPSPVPSPVVNTIYFLLEKTNIQ